MTPKEKIITVLVIISLIFSALSLVVTVFDLDDFRVVKTVHRDTGGGKINLFIEGNNALVSGAGE